MSTEAKLLSPEEQVKIVCVETQIDPTIADSIYADFASLFKQAEEWKAKAATLVITDASQIREMKIAREARLALKDIRISAEKKRKALKEDSLRRGKAIDGVANIVRYLVEPIEAHLAAQEQFVERKEAERKAVLKVSREELLRPYGVNTTAFLLDVMDDGTFEQLLLNIKTEHAQKIEAAKKAEAARIAEEARKAAEKEKLEAEVAIARKEQSRLEEEKKKLSAQLERERLATAEANRKADDEQKRRLQSELNAAQLRAAEPGTGLLGAAQAVARVIPAIPVTPFKAVKQTDGTRMSVVAQQLRQFFLPLMETVDGRNCMIQIRETLEEMATALEEEGKNFK